ncbi:MAG: hypothetical protein FJ033_07010 [Chloroflexi bacterium]|nr:hypothetical protein [Chloroflexota bacterium]
MARGEREPTRVLHPARPELGIGEVTEVVQGKPAVLHVFWPDVDKHGYYLITDVRRVPERRDNGQIPRFHSGGEGGAPRLE